MVYISVGCFFVYLSKDDYFLRVVFMYMKNIIIVGKGWNLLLKKWDFMYIS